MLDRKKLILLNGSPRKNKTSYSFARTIKMLAEDIGCVVEIFHVIDYFDGKYTLDELKASILTSDVIGLVAPLYVDTLPYPNIWLFDKLYQELENEQQGKDFFMIGQCGFPDITLCQPMIESCRYFAETVGMNWLGGLSYGGGSIIDGELLENLGRKGKKITSAFKLALEDIFQGKKISSKPQELLTLRIPKIIYRPLAAFLNYKIKQTARKHGVTDIFKKVYLE